MTDVTIRLDYGKLQIVALGAAWRLGVCIIIAAVVMRL